MELNKDIYQEELDEIISILKKERHSTNKLAIEAKVIDIWADQDSTFHYSLLMKEEIKCESIKFKKFKNYTLVGYPLTSSFRNYCIALVENKFLDNLLKTKPPHGGVTLKRG